jgi:hypothetical protein
VIVPLVVLFCPGEPVMKGSPKGPWLKKGYDALQLQMSGGVPPFIGPRPAVMVIGNEPPLAPQWNGPGVLKPRLEQVAKLLPLRANIKMTNKQVVTNRVAWWNFIVNSLSCAALCSWDRTS